MAASDADVGQEPGLLVLAGRALAVGALVIAASAGLFLGIGALGDDDGVEDGDPGSGDGVAAPDEDVDPGSSGEDSQDQGDAGDDPDAGTDGDAPDGGAEGPENDAGDDAEPDPDGGTEDTEAGTEDEGSGEVSDEDEADDDDGSPAIPAEDISVQVLDGYGGDGRAAADAVAATLSEAGYRIIAQNPALAYEVTTVFWTAGNEDAARQVAAEIGATAVDQQPGNLSESVMVHVVVGADRA